MLWSASQLEKHGKKSNNKHEFGPKDFLASLGIGRPPKGGVFTDRLWQDIASRGAIPEVRHDGGGFHPAVCDMYFVDAEIARKVPV